MTGQQAGSMEEHDWLHRYIYYSYGLKMANYSKSGYCLMNNFNIGSFLRIFFCLLIVSISSIVMYRYTCWLLSCIDIHADYCHVSIYMLIIVMYLDVHADYRSRLSYTHTRAHTHTHTQTHTHAHTQTHTHMQTNLLHIKYHPIPFSKTPMSHLNVYISHVLSLCVCSAPCLSVCLSVRLSVCL